MYSHFVQALIELEMGIKQISADNKWKIIASSFILSPASAVKELIDNSIDASAKAINVDIDSETGGCRYISIRDNGGGVRPEDREMMCLNHCTSKIEDITDIGDISTLGFRGEALFLLSALASSKGSLEVITRTEDEKIGERWLTGKDGSIIPKSLRKISSPVGTSITLKNLLGGLYARQKDLERKSTQTIKDISNLVNHYSIEFREIRFVYSLVSLTKNGSITNKQVQTSINPGLSRVRTLSNMIMLRKSVDQNFWFQDDFVINNLYTIDFIIPNMLPEMEIINKKMAFKYVSVNHRPLSNKLEIGRIVTKKLNNIYRESSLLEPHVWYVNFNCSGNLIDVNIEPEKNNVLIANIDAVMNDFESGIRSVVESKLGKHINKDGESIRSNIVEVDNAPQVIPDEKMEDSSSGSDIIEIESRNTPVMKETTKPRESESSVSKDNITLTNEDEPNVIIPSIKRRKLTEGSLASEDDDTKWAEHMSDYNKPSSLPEEDAQIELPSSLTNNYEQMDNIDEDLELSRDISISNPFTIAKLKRFNRQEKPTREDKTCNSRNFDATPGIPRIRQDDEAGLIPIDKSTLRKEKITHKYNVRRLCSFSEYTNSYLSESHYKLSGKIKSGNETVWLERDSKLISNPLIEILSQFSHTNPLDTINRLKMTAHGWYILGNEENAPSS